MAPRFGFLGEGCREIGRKIKRSSLRGKLAGQDRQRQEALARLGACAWQAKVDLTEFPDFREQLQRLEERSGALAATTQKLETERAALQARRASEMARFDTLCRPVLATKADAEAALRTARERLDVSDRTIRGIEARLAQVAAALTKLEASPATGQAEREQLQSEQRTLSDQAAAARPARESQAAAVNKLSTEAKRLADEVARIEAERKAALLPIDAELNRVQQESRGATQETANVGREQNERFTQLGASLYDRQVMDPALAESNRAVAAVDQARAATKAALDASVGVTQAMPHGTMLKFWGVVALVPVLLIALTWAVRLRSRDSGPVRYAGSRTYSGRRGSTGRMSLRADESKKDAALQAFLRAPRDPAARKEGVEVLAQDLLTLGSTADRTYLPNVTKILQSSEPELRTAALHAIAMIRPTAAEKPLLLNALNDPVPAVRNAAAQALEQFREDAAARLLVRRVYTAGKSQSPSDSERLEAQAVPDARRLGVPVYQGATYLHYASDPESGRAAFSSQDSWQQVLDFYASKAGRPPLKGDEFTRLYFGGSPADPMGAKRLMAENDAWIKQALAAKKPEQEIKAEAERRGAQMLNLPLVRYADAELYGTPSFVPLEEASAAGSKRAVRFVVVFQDHALARTGIEVHVPPESR